MRKTYVVDTNVLLQSPAAIACFEENQVIIPLAVIEELDGLKNAEGEKGANARTAIRLLEKYRQEGDLLEGIELDDGGFLRVEKNYIDVTLPPDLPDSKMDNRILKGMDMEPGDIAVIVSAIGNHDENTGNAVDPVSAAVIIADKTDVRRNRVRSKAKASFDMHDRVNYAVMESKVEVNKEKRMIHLDITLDENTCSVLDYFEIFLERMLMCRRAAEVLKMKFKLTANGSKVL